MDEYQGDWRLSTFSHPAWKWLFDAVVRRTNYVESREQSDHCHCAFCWTRFVERGDDCWKPPVLHVGYKADDGAVWICDACFRDFCDHFNWLIAESPDGIPLP